MRCRLLPVIVSGYALSALATERVEGEIALSAPQCDFFAGQTGRDFSLLHEDVFYSVFEGAQIRGALHTSGSQEVEIVGEATMGVTIEDWGLTLDQAKTIFYPRCGQ